MDMYLIRTLLQFLTAAAVVVVVVVIGVGNVLTKNECYAKQL